MLSLTDRISFRFIALSLSFVRAFRQYLLLKEKEITFFHWIDSFCTNPERTVLFKVIESKAFALPMKINTSGFS